MTNSPIAQFLTRYIALTLILLISACSSSAPKIEENDIAILEVREKVLLSPQESFDLLEEVLSEYDLHTMSGLKDDSTFQTNSIRVMDRMCDADYIREASLPCHVSFEGSVSPVGNGDISVLILRYRQYCHGQQHIPSTCKGSNAEQMLFSIHKKIQEKAPSRF